MVDGGRVELMVIEPSIAVQIDPPENALPVMLAKFEPLDLLLCSLKLINRNYPIIIGIHAQEGISQVFEIILIHF